MKLSFYNDEIDKILWDIIGNDSFNESDLPDLIEMLTDTIYQYNKDLTKKKLKSIIQFLVEQKYKQIYVYDTDLEFNKIIKQETHSIVKNQLSEKSQSELMSISASELNDYGDILVQKKYTNPELDSEETDKVHFSSADDLISHRHDYPFAKYKEKKYIKRRKQRIKIKKIPQYEQKSAEWLKQRNECLTATAVAIALDEDPYKYPVELLLDKCGRKAPFEENENVHHGKKYEQIGNMFYSFRNNIKVAEYGLIQDEKYVFIGASPDGICEKNTLNTDKLSKLVGRLLEIKFPKTRKINTEGKLDGDICPHYYYVQVQTQLYVTKMDECDFLQCRVEEYDSWEDFVQDSNTNIPGLSKMTNLEKGCLIQLLPRNMVGKDDPKMCLYNAKYIYPSRLHLSNDEIERWIADEILHFHKNELSNKYIVDRIIYWRLSQVACHLIKADTEWFETKIPLLKQFWDYVLFYRKNTKKLDSLMKFINEVGVKKSAEIFSKVHKDYASVYKNTKYKPLYQKESVWRKKYNKKYENYQKFIQYQKNKTYYTNKKKVIVDV